MTSTIRGSDNFDTALGLGVGQTPQNLNGSRLLSTAYTNNTGQPIFISVLAVQASGVASTFLACTVNGVQAAWSGAIAANQAINMALSCIVPVGATYSVAAVTGSASLVNWTETRAP